MKRNTLFHHKKNHRNNFNKSKDRLQLRDSFIQNPQSSAKFCLLQISEEAQKINNRTFTAFQSHHSRTFSTELFPQKKIVIQNQINENEQKNCIKSTRYQKAQSHQSVALKSTFSNEMRKTNHFHFNKKDTENDNQRENYRSEQNTPKWESLKKLRKINYLPLKVKEQKQIEKIDEIFHNTPSRQILAILKRTNLAKEIKQNEKQIQKSQEKITTRRKSIFNIRHLMMRDKNGSQSARKEKQSPQTKNENHERGYSKEKHFNNNYNVIKMRLKNRYNNSALENK